MRTLFMLLISMILLASVSLAQVGINNDNSVPDPSAGLDVKFINKGFLPPRMTIVERHSISSPAAYLIIVNTTTRCLEAYNQTASNWETIHCFECPLPSSPLAGIHVPSVTQIIWNWNTVSGATGYKWNTTNDYGSATDMGTSTAKTETGLTCGTAYTRYV